MNKFIETLDRRLEKTSKDISGLVAKKERVVGEPSSSSPPVGAPSWAVNGMNVLKFVLNIVVIDIKIDMQVHIAEILTRPVIKL